MRLCRFGENRLGLVREDEVLDVTAALEGLPSVRYPLPRVDPLIAHLSELRPRIEAEASRARPVPAQKLALLSPVANPGKVMAAPVNYQKHIEEAQADPGIHHQKRVLEIHQAGLFLKATSSVVGPSQGIAIRHPERRTDHEIELAAIIGTRADRVPAERALAHVAAYCIGLDITVRGPEERSLRKSVDSYTVLGPWLVTADEVGDPGNLGLHLTVNGETRQKANTSDLIISVAGLIAFASSFYTLEPGDVLLTGTPEGVGPIRPGDMIEAHIERIGSMRVPVRALDPVS
jgi:2-keto-4-pentenoate hydratase/2-oxohepta-3-ene-1,7-dioic acid hydratase in catechol pathway